MTMRLKTVSYLIAGTGFLLVLIAGIALDVVTTEMHRDLLAYAPAQSATLTSERLKGHLRDTLRFNGFWIFSGSPEFLRQRDQSRQNVRTDIQTMETYGRRKRDTSLLNETRQAIDVLFQSQNRVAQIAAKNRKQALALLPPLSHQLDQTLIPLDHLANLKSVELAEIENKTAARENLASWVARVTILLSLVLFVTLLWLLHSDLIKPMKIFIQAIIAYRNGNHDTRIPTERLKVAEISEASVEFNSMAERIGELEARKMNYMVGTVHDIRNPLTVLKTAAKILQSQKEGQTTPETQRLLKVVNEQVDRMSHLITDCIDSQQVQSGRIRLTMRSIDITSVVEEAVHLWRLESKSHVVAFAKPDHPVSVRCDPNRIQQALNNLLSNAIKYSPDGGLVAVTIDEKSRQGNVIVSVADKGLGIAPKDVKKIFEPFTRGSAVSGIIPGTGLGLSSAKKIVEAHGGTIEVESRVGWGSVFRIVIPAASTEERLQRAG